MPEQSCKPLVYFVLMWIPLMSFGPYFRHLTTNDGLPSSEVYMVTQDRQGFIWFATDRGVSRYNGYSFTNFSYKDGLTDDVVFGFHEDYQNRLWFFTYSGGLCYFKDDKIITPAFNDSLIHVMQELSYPVITSMYVDRTGQIWLGSLTYHIITISPQGKIQVPVHPPYLPGKRTILMQVDSSAHGFVSTGRSFNEVKELYYHSYTRRDYVIPIPSRPELDGKDRTFFTSLNPDTFIYVCGTVAMKLTHNGVLQSAILPAGVIGSDIDKEGNLWISTYRSVVYFPKADLNQKPDVYLQEHSVTSSIQDHEGGYWFTTLNDGVFYLSNQHIYSITRNETGLSKLIYLARNSKGIFAAGSTGLVFFPRKNPTKINPISRQPIYMGFWKDQITYYDKFMQPWATDGIHTKKIDRAFAQRLCNDNRSPFTWKDRDRIFVYDRSNDLKVDSIMFIFSGRKTAVAIHTQRDEQWVGTLNGLYHLIEGRLSIERNPIFNERVTDLDFLDTDRLLVTTRRKGIYILNTLNNQVTMIKGLPSEYCTRTWVDSDTTVWTASYEGVSRIRHILSNPEITSFSVHEGILSNEVLDVMIDGQQVWLATAAGISIFDKDWTPDSIHVLSPGIARIRINEKDTMIHTQYHLPYTDNSIQLNFSGLSYRIPIKYYYRMRGLNDEWIMTTNPYASFSSMKPGNYTFELTITSPDDKKSEPVQIHFHIHAPLWQRSWFHILIGAVIVLSIVIFIRYRYRFINKENKLYNLFARAEQKALRAQINPHFVFNAMNSVLELLSGNHYKKASDYLAYFSKLMRYILEYSREEEITVTQEIALLELYIKIESLRFEDQLLAYTIECDPKIDTEHTLIPSMLIQPYVENAIKHGVRGRDDGQGKVTIRFIQEEQTIKVYIADNGLGIQNTRAKHKKNASLGMKINEERIKLSGFLQLTYTVHMDHAIHDPMEKYPGTLIVLSFPLKKKQEYVERPD